MTTEQTLTETCGCADFSRSRRRFLRNLAAVAGASLVLPATGSTFVQAAFASTSRAQNVLLVLSLRGGADGLSLVVPHGDRAYGQARPTIAVPTARLLERDDMFGLHPAFRPLVPMWRAGRFAAVHAVGLPQPNRSHFEALEAIEDADPGSPERRGWLNRLISLDTEVSPIEAVQIGSPIVPTSLYGDAPVLAVNSLRQMFLPGRDNPGAYERRVASLRAAWQRVPGAFGQGARSAVDMSTAFEQLVEELTDPQNGARYPKTDVGRSMAQAAQLIRADIGAEVITVDGGDWDMHTALGTVERGRMHTEVSALARSLSAFFTDLGEQGKNVTVVTISEFGRRVEENADHGLDHGYGNVMLLFGAGVRGGRYYGRWPGLGSDRLIDGDLSVTRDYRSVLAEVVRSRFDADVSRVFPGFRPEDIGVML